MFLRAPRTRRYTSLGTGSPCVACTTVNSTDSLPSSGIFPSLSTPMCGWNSNNTPSTRERLWPGHDRNTMDVDLGLTQITIGLQFTLSSYSKRCKPEGTIPFNKIRSTLVSILRTPEKCLCQTGWWPSLRNGATTRTVKGAWEAVTTSRRRGRYGDGDGEGEQWWQE
ncbi:hypothetical protein C8F01DRAFT_487810 [Mycena amicta]|nr:hypothetical protein C8F01DRAFT_487810 [Mycena amicta]